jgi:hypothetical protein
LKLKLSKNSKIISLMTIISINWRIFFFYHASSPSPLF